MRPIGPRAILPSRPLWKPGMLRRQALAGGNSHPHTCRPYGPWPSQVHCRRCMSDKAVLYVEDDENIVFFLKQAFETVGRKESFYVCADGDQAIDFLAGNAQSNVPERTVMPSLVLLDLHLPKKSGFEVLQWIRHHPVFFTTPVIMFS